MLEFKARHNIRHLKTRKFSQLNGCNKLHKCAVLHPFSSAGALLTKSSKQYINSDVLTDDDSRSVKKKEDQLRGIMKSEGIYIDQCKRGRCN